MEDKMRDNVAPDEEDFLLEQAREKHFEEKEFNLSEKIEKIKWKDGVVLKLGLKTEDVKEFIRLLKEEICNPDAFISMDEKIIDKLAGDDLK